jgi:hypothetical protein
VDAQRCWLFEVLRAGCGRITNLALFAGEVEVLELTDIDLGKFVNRIVSLDRAAFR